MLGAFQITVPVTTAETILPNEQRALSITRAILATIPQENRWHLPFQRYVSQIADRVNAFGGDSGAPGGDRGPGQHPRGCIAIIVDVILRLFGKR